MAVGSFSSARRLQPPASPGLEVRLDRSGQAPRVVVTGELDSATTPILAGPLVQATRGHPGEVTVDVREMTFCDASGLRVLATAAADLHARGGHLTVLGPCPALQILVNLLGADAGLTLVPPPATSQFGAR